MNYGTTHGDLKPLNEVILPDPRFEHEVLRSETSKRSMTLADVHERLQISKLNQSVPDKVKVQFETARNLMLYAWFVFEFQTIAEMQAYAALELALRERFNNPTKTIFRKKKTKIVPLMLFELLARAVNEGLIVPEKLPFWEWHNYRTEWLSKAYELPSKPVSAQDWLQSIKTSLPDSRNHLAHGNPKLWLPHSFSQLELCADLINALFQSAEKPSTKT